MKELSTLEALLRELLHAVADANRYRQLRDMAVVTRDLEAVVALNQLEHYANIHAFDAAVDKIIAARNAMP